jgi:hypothetical protein
VSINCFHNHNHHYKRIVSKLQDTNTNEEYRNVVARFLSQLLPNSNSVSSNSNSNSNILDKIQWSKPKRSKTSLTTLSKDLMKALKDREWFVTGNVVPTFFDDNFAFQVLLNEL